MVDDRGALGIFAAGMVQFGLAGIAVCTENARGEVYG